MSNDPLLLVDDVWKKYSRSIEASLKYGLRDTFGEAFDIRQSEELREQEFWALRGASFEVRRGDAVGLMGRNGAGKSTLLKVISGILKPDRGSVTVTGHVEQMIEMAGGFKRELTGRENIIMRARMIGIPRSRLSSLIEEIVDFTELGEFIDSPVSFYSSGMKARLGFSLATLRTPDLLIVDEALAVGDLPFRLKCYERISDMLKSSALLMVSHTTGNVKRFCNRGGYLKKGRMEYFGDLQDAIRVYQDEYVVGKQQHTAYNPERIPVRWESGGQVLNEADEVASGGDMAAIIDTTHLPADSTVYVRLRVPDGTHLAEWNSRRAGFELASGSPIRIELGPLALAPNYYAVAAFAMAADGHTLLAMSPFQQFKLVGEYENDVPLQFTGSWSVAS